jgi:hypothetical protein
MTVTTYPAAPTATPLRGTLLHAASVNSDSGYRMVHETEELFQSYNCMRFDAETGAWCAPSETPKTFVNPAWTHGFRFGVYGGVECKAIGIDFNEMQANARKVFETGESTGVERALMRAAFAEGPDDPDDAGTPLWVAAEDITPTGGAVSANLAVALLEGFMGDLYSGVPTLHLPRTVASLLVGPETVKFEGDLLTTKLGSKIAAGAGYDFPNLGPDGTPAAEGERWVYATGEVYLNRGDLIVREGVDTTNNDVRVLVERPYMAALDCATTVAIRVNLSA